MDLLSKLTAALSGTAPPRLTASDAARDKVLAFENEAARARPGWPVDRGKLERFQTAIEILERDRLEWPDIVAAVFVRLKEIDDDRAAMIGARSYTIEFLSRSEALRELVARLLRPRLDFSDQQLAAIIQHCATCLEGTYFKAPLGLLLKQVEDRCQGQAVTGVLARSIAHLASAITQSRYMPQKSAVELAKWVERLLSGASDPVPSLVQSAWRDRLLANVGALSGNAAEISRRAIECAVGAAGKSKPGLAFLKTARALLEQDPPLAARMLDWIESYVPDRASPDPNEGAIRGFIWMLSQGEGESIAPRIGKFCDLCFKKIPNVGARSVKLGNGAIQTLGLLGGAHAIAELTRLKKKVRYPLVVRQIEATLADLATRAGMSSDELEEISLPTYELSPEGERRVPVGEGVAILRVAGTHEVSLTWAQPNGREAASVPKALKETAREAVASVRSVKKEIEGTLAGQSGRMESLYLSGRQLPFDVWRQRYWHHPLLAGMVRRLIWRFERSGRSLSGLPRNGIIENTNGEAIEISPDDTVTLWHPLHAEANQVLAWRKRLEDLEITQPFKQAYREIYVVTDAERQTGIYSNRFAAHVLRQHQFKALSDQRGWRYHLMGDWDSHNTPTRLLQTHGLSAEFWVDAAEPNERAGTGVYTLIATDQVRFIGRDGAPVGITEVPRLVFSELMRDVDLFVGVASVGNDPNWVDGGPDGRFRAYWGNYAFGELAESGMTRAAALAALLPRLAIAGQCELVDRFLVVRGKLRTYRIHLGSGNIQMDPNNQYLCIVPGRGLSDRSPSTDNLVLPFEGDRTLSIILSKAFLLSADDRINDPSILRQIRPT